MACDWEIFIAHDDGEYARQAAFAAFEEVDRIEDDLSRFREGSDVRRLNGAAPGETIRVGPYARDCLLLSGELSELTDGAFDVMVARAMDEIRAGGTSRADLLPQEPLLEINASNGAVTILGERRSDRFRRARQRLRGGLLDKCAARLEHHGGFGARRHQFGLCARRAAG